MTKIRDLMPWDKNTPVSVSKGFSLTALQDEMNRLFDHFYNGFQVHLTDWDQKLATAPAMNVTETADSFKVEAALPGVDAKQVNVEIAGNLLTVSGESRTEKEEQRDRKNGGYLRQEITFGAFVRTISLPETADGEKAKASFRNGILTISVPKKAGAMQKPRKIEIKEAA